MKDTKDLEDFFKSTYGLCGIIMRGFYDLHWQDFMHFFKLYLETGKNHLNDYHIIRDNCFEKDNNRLINFDELEHLESSLKNKEVTMFFDEEDIEQAYINLYHTKEHYKKEFSYINRKKHSKTFLKNKDVRKAIFARKGEFCKKCKSTEKLQLDHIIPLIRGGENHVDNLQVLCASCNSSKGSRLEEELS